MSLPFLFEASTYCGVTEGSGRFFRDIIIPSLGAVAGVLAFTFAGLWPIWRRIVSWSGIPGVGVAPGFIGLPAVLESGIPGVGVPPFGGIAT
jgi:hypothetical protein